MKIYWKAWLTIITLLTFLVSCEEVPENPMTRTFIVQQGEHYSTPRLTEVLQSDRLVFTARFNESAIYDLGSEALQSNKNKLMGFSDCNSLHHENSARFGWQWFNNQLEIYAYCYVNSERVEQMLGVVQLNEENLYEIRLNGGNYEFYLNGEKTASIARGTTCDKGVYYMLSPYFGGSVAAPHDVSIDINIHH